MQTTQFFEVTRSCDIQDAVYYMYCFFPHSTLQFRWIINNSFSMIKNNYFRWNGDYHFEITTQNYLEKQSVKWVLLSFLTPHITVCFARVVLQDPLHHGKMQLVLKADQYDSMVTFARKELFLPEIFQRAVHCNPAQICGYPKRSFFIYVYKYKISI